MTMETSNYYPTNSSNSIAIKNSKKMEIFTPLHNTSLLSDVDNRILQMMTSLKKAMSSF
jgi:hypothetical protein